MDSFELNKVAGAVLGTLLFALGTGFVAELIYEPKPAGNRGWELPGGSAEHGGGAEKAEKTEAEAPKADSIAALLAHADADKGKAGTKACQGCHNFEEGAGNKVGPDLYNVVERQKGSVSGFEYSAGLKGKGGAWTYEDLDQFLTKPSAYVKGTKMSYAGIQAPQDRANVIAYLRSLSKDPKPLPAADKAEGKKEEGKAEAKGGDKGAEKKDEGKKTENEKPAEKGAGNGGSTNGTSQGADKPAKAEPAGGSDNAKPDAPPAPAATDAPVKPDPAAEEKAKQEQSGQDKGGQEKPAQQ